MKVSPLPYEARIATGFTHVAEIVAADLTQVTAATAQTIELIPVALGSLVEKAAVLVETAFADASDTAFNSVTVEVGDGGSAARFLAAQQVNVNGTEVMAKGGTGTLHAYTGTDTVDIKFNSMSDKSLVDIDTGKLFVFLSVRELPAQV